MKMLVCFGLRFACLFLLLAWPWPGLRNLVCAGFRAQTRLLGSATLPRQSFRVEAFSDSRHSTVDTVVLLTGLRTPGPAGGLSAAEIPFDSTSQGWIPFAMWIALCVSTPLPWSKRWRGLLAGALVVQVLVMATILVSLYFNLTNLTSQASSLWPRFPLLLANRLLVENIWFSFVPPFVLWVGWLAGRGHWEQLWLRGLGGPEGARGLGKGRNEAAFESRL
jgi:hypothetical protein